MTSLVNRLARVDPPLDECSPIHLQTELRHPDYVSHATCIIDHDVKLLWGFMHRRNIEDE